MPAPVPPGYTRGPIVLMAAPGSAPVEQILLHWLFSEAGGFGARFVLITVEPAHAQSVARLRSQLASWECEQVHEIVALDRSATRDPAHVAPIEQATGIVLIGNDPLRWAALIGGTPLAQAIRRANARSKLVAGIGAVSAFLPQHIISPGTQPTTLRQAVSFAPGLGLVNRLVVDANEQGDALGDDTQQQLLAAVVTNPYLIAMGLPTGAAAILYPDNTLQASGPNPLTVVDGQAIEAAELNIELDAEREASPMHTAAGALYYTLHTGAGFNLDDHTLRPVGEIDLPPTGPVTSVF
jgi:cyanophycinase